MGEKAATNEVITKLMSSALGDESDDVRGSACLALGEMGEKAATNEVITKLVSALVDEEYYVRNYACDALGKMGEKAATNEVITKLVSALGDESDHVRNSACVALRNMGEKAATNEVITKLVGALGDESDDVRMYACEALEAMGEKAATKEVITKLVVLMNSNSDYRAFHAAQAVKNILISSAVIKQLAPEIVGDLCLCKYASDCLKNISEDELMNVFLRSESPDCLLAVTQLTLQSGAAVTATKNKVVVYGKKEPVELHIPNSELYQRFIEAFIDQRKLLQLSP
jgi:HEAT repeat protein